MDVRCKAEWVGVSGRCIHIGTWPAETAAWCEVCLVWLAARDSEMHVGRFTVFVVCLCWTAMVHVWWWAVLAIRLYVIDALLGGHSSFGWPCLGW